MIRTNIEIQSSYIYTTAKRLITYKLNTLSIQLLSVLLGFFASTALSTIPAQTGDWGILAAAIIVTNQEIISKIIYQGTLSKQYKKYIFLRVFLKHSNSIKIGVLYGLFVDAFKLGS